MVFLTPESYSEDSCGVLLLTIFLKRWQDRQNNQSDNQQIIDLKLKKSLEYTWDFFSSLAILPAEFDTRIYNRQTLLPLQP